MRSGINGGDPGSGQEDVSAEALAQAADALFLAMRRSRSTLATREGGLSIAQLTLLEPFLQDRRIPVGRLAAGADVSVPTATRMLKQLEAKGVVSRERSATDERQVLVDITDEGAVKLAEAQAKLRERQARAFAAFAPSERVQLVDLMKRLSELVADSDAERDECPARD